MPQSLTSAAFANVGKLTRTPRGLLPLLLLLIATPGWNQISANGKGPHLLPPNASLSLPSANAAVLASNNTSVHYNFLTIDIKASTYTVANGINNERLISGYFADAGSVYHGFLWQEGGVTKLDYPSAAYTKLYSVNNRGEVIGFYGNSAGTAEHTVTYAVLSHKWTNLPDIPGYPFNEGYGINDEGAAVGNAYSTSGTSIAWIWNAATSSYSFFTVPAASPSSTYPSGLNDKGQIAGYYFVGTATAGVWHGFLKEYSTFTTIDMPGAEDTFLDGLNNSGVIQGQIFDAAGQAEGFIATSGGVFTAVNYPTAMSTAIVGINDRGDVCGGYSFAPDFAGGGMAFVALHSER